MRIKELGFLFADKNTAGPDPIDRPQMTISFGFTPNIFTK